MKKKKPYYKTPAGQAAHRKSNLKRLYGITLEEYDELLLQQNGLCAICGRFWTQFKKPFVVDHDHNTGAVRSLLCPACNTAIGLFQDDPVLLEKAALYLRKGGAGGC